MSESDVDPRNTAPDPDADPAARDERPMLSPWRVGAWAAELLSVPTGLVDAYLPGSAGVNARTREQLILAVTEVNGCRYTAWVHGAWLDFLGPRDPDEALAPLFDYARACAEAGVPLDTTTLDAAYPRAIVRSVRATVARAELANLVGNTVDDLVERINGQRTWSPVTAAEDVVAVMASLPLIVPTVAVASTMKVIARLAPKLPEIDLPPASEANLVVHLLAEAAPTYLGHAFVRTSLVYSPLPIAIAFRMEGTSATIRVGRGRVAIGNGVQPDALLVVDGGVERLLQTVAGSILRDLGVPMRRR